MALITSPVTVEGTDKGLFLKPFITEPTIEQLGWSTMFGQQTGWMYFHSMVDKITKKRTDCGYPAQGDAATITRKSLVPVHLQSYYTQCADVFDETILAAARKTGNEQGDLSGTQVYTILEYIYRPAVIRDMLRIAILGDTSLVSDANYSMIDGWLKKLKSQITGSQDLGSLSDTDINETNIKATMESVYVAQTRLLRNTPVAQKAFYVSYSVFNAWQNYLLGITGLESSKTEMVTGNIPTTYKGIQLIPIELIDEYITDTEGTSHPGNVIILAKKDQTGIMVDSPAAGAEFDFWYSKDDDLNKFSSRYMMDIQIGYTEFFVTKGF